MNRVAWRSWVLRRVAVSYLAARAAEKLSAHTIADKLDRARSGGDLVAIRLPALPHELRTRRVKMYRIGGEDLVAQAFLDHGWTGFERPLPDLFRLAVSASPGEVIDVGANSGIYALISAATRPDLTVHAFEPFLPATQLLRRNLALNGVTRQVRVVEAAVGDQIGEAVLYVPVSVGALESSCSLNPTFKEHVDQQLSVALVTLDDYWGRLGEPPIGVIKVDVESMEHLVLRGGGRLMESQRPLIFYELLPAGSADELERLRLEHQLVDIRLRSATAVIDEPIKFDPEAWNHLMAPAERVEEVLQWLRRLKIVDQKG